MPAALDMSERLMVDQLLPVVIFLHLPLSSDCRRLPLRLAALFLPIALAASGVSSRLRFSRMARARSEALYLLKTSEGTNASSTESTSIGLAQCGQANVRGWRVTGVGMLSRLSIESIGSIFSIATINSF
jgi:hypothetical protein